MKTSTILAGVLCILMAGCGGNAEKSEKTDSSAVAREQADSLAEESDQGDVQKKERPLTIAVVGDIMMGTQYPAGNLPSDGGSGLFKDTAPILQRVDVAAGNLEGVLFDGEGVRKPCGNIDRCFAFKMPEKYVDHLVEAGFDVVSIANNHVNDWGPQAYQNTQTVLAKAAIEFAGDAEKKPYTVFEKEGRKIGFAAFGFNSGMPSIHDFGKVTEIVRDLRGKCDILVVSFHGGGEGKDFQHVPHKTEQCFGMNRGDVEKFAHTAVDAGADVVFGHSPHVNRALELYNDRLIAYSLGNFCTPYRFNISGVNGYAPIVEMTLNPDGTFAEGQIHSFIQTRGIGPRSDKTNVVAKNIARLTKEDFPNTPLAIADDGKISRK